MYRPRSIFEFMSRTVEERFLLPPTEEGRLLILGVLARALWTYPLVQLYAFTFLSNHYHLLASALDGGSLARFIGYINSNIAREMARLHGWKGRFWNDRASVIEVVDDDAVVDRLRYVISQGVKEGLVGHALDWTGASSTPALLGDMQLDGIWVNRDRQTRAARRAKPPAPKSFEELVEVRLTPIPQWAHLAADQLRARHQALVDEVEARAASTRSAPPLGMRAILAQSAFARPAESKQSRPPLCHASTEASRRGFHEIYRAFVDAFRSAANSIRERAHQLFPDFPPNGFPRPLAFVPEPSDPARPGAQGCQWPSGSPPLGAPQVAPMSG